MSDVAALRRLVSDTFRAHFAAQPRLARAPGRVNIIGEHTDYNGLPVLPMAIDREIAVAFAPRADSRVTVTDTSERFFPCEFHLSNAVPASAPGDWVNYVKAGAQALWLWAEENQPDALPLKGFMGCFGGTIPAGSGLSSSSALVVASALAIAAVNDLQIEKPQLADVLAKGERYVGTEGGGMDQAVSLLAEEGKALKIDFFPLRTRPVPLPPGYLLVVANSMVSAKKSGEARLAYNTRVAECKLGLQMLKHVVLRQHQEVAGALLLRDFAEAVHGAVGYLDALPDGALSLGEIAAFLGVSVDDLASRCLRQRDGSLFPYEEVLFEPKRRCRHVLTEGVRVNLAADALLAGDAARLGELMNESHASCADDYGISCEELDVLVGILLRHGAYGARLTGAGFGGCAVALVRSEEANAVMDAVWNDYFGSYRASKGYTRAADRNAVLFACKPVQGAGLLD